MPIKKFTQELILSSLIQTAYLPIEIPPAVTSRHFSAYIKTNFSAWKDFKPKDQTNFEKFSIPRENNSRRDLALVHPAAQLRLSIIISENYNEIRKIISSSKKTLYDSNPDFKNFKAFKGVNFRELDPKRSEVAKLKSFILITDISRFFYTIYTHSLPWAILGKEKVKDSIFKKDKKFDKHWTSQIDYALQACQSRETFGIPVGPDTSRIIAELLISGVRKNPKVAEVFDSSPGFRLVDDIFVGFDSDAYCRYALVTLRNALADFNLQLNDDKTWIKPSEEIFTDKWRQDLRQILIPKFGAKRQAQAIDRLSDLALFHASQIGNGFPVKWAIQRLVNVKIEEDNFGLLLSTILRLSRDFPVSINIVAAFIINSKKKCSSEPISSQIKAWINAIFQNHAKHGHDLEVAWALVVCGALKIKVTKKIFGDYTESMCSVVFAILGLLNTHGLLAEPLSKFEWKAEVKKSGLNNNHWLMYYESVLRKWTKDKNMISEVKSHTLFGKLMENKISFLDDTIFGDVVIDLDARRMRFIAKMTAADLESWGISSV